MIILFIVGLLLGAAAVVFALQNVAVITVSFFSWQIEGSLALILLMAMLTGTLVALLLVLPESISNYFRNKGLRKTIKHLQEELRKQKERTVFAHQDPATPEELQRIADGAIVHEPFDK